jgi:hypothetical protein
MQLEQKAMFARSHMRDSGIGIAVKDCFAY